MTFEFPLLVSVVVNELLLPTLTLPKLKLDELNPSTRVAATPVPLREIVVGELGALLTNVIDPVTLPAALGPNTALNVVAFPAPIVTGAVIPAVLNPAPVTVTDEIVTVALPPFVRLMVCELFVPVVTLPKAAAVGVADNCGLGPGPAQGNRKRRIRRVADDCNCSSDASCRARSEHCVERRGFPCADGHRCRDPRGAEARA